MRLADKQSVHRAEGPSTKSHAIEKLYVRVLLISKGERRRSRKVVVGVC